MNKPYRNQLTQPGWDGTFVGIRPSGTVSQEGDSSISLGTFSAPHFEGFNGPYEKGVIGPTSGASNGQPTNGTFPGEGTGSDSFKGPYER